MDQLLFPLLSYIFIYVIYLIGKFIMAIRFGIHDRHIFLGYGQHPVFNFRLSDVTISVGLFIPFPFLARFYNIESILKGISSPFNIIEANLVALGRLLTGEAVEKSNRSGPIAIAELFSSDKVLYRFFKVTAIYLAGFCLFEIFPYPRSAATRTIPMWIELIFRKKVSIKLYSGLHKFL